MHAANETIINILLGESVKSDKLMPISNFN